jgi:hypothetical protein
MLFVLQLIEALNDRIVKLGEEGADFKVIRVPLKEEKQTLSGQLRIDLGVARHLIN